MKRLQEAVIGQKAMGRFGGNGAMLDLTFGGQGGYSTKPDQILSSQGYVQQHLVCIVLDTPRFLTLLPEAEKWQQVFKSLFEEHVRVIDGYKAGLEATFDEHAIGGAGEMFEEVTDVKRERSTPSFEVTERYGRPIQNLLEIWMTYGMMDSESKFAMMGTLDKIPEDALADWFTMSVLVYEPDPLNRKVNKAWISTNMMPKGTNEITGKRDLTTAKELKNLTIEMTAFTQYGAGPRALAQTILDGMNRSNANPALRPAMIDQIDPALTAANLAGYKEDLNTLATTAIKVL